ncbi:MAG: hypothetical protein P9L97_04180 [Candidatus Tenebribacter davisii]|nr:hypothetical protein [Candidatus Tenebribacter davisii]
MRSFAKWVAIIWSIICLIGIIYGMANVGDSFDSSDDYESAGAAIGLGCGLGIWIIFWFVIAGPALIIYTVSGKKIKKSKNVIESKDSSLCQACGKYYEGSPKFCPNCGKSINKDINSN